MTDLDGLAARLRSGSGSVRMQASMAAGTAADPAAVGLLVERCGVDPDFFVRDMLTWALTRMPSDEVVPRLVEELSSPFPQARSQALHTLSKIGDARALPAVTDALLHDEEDEVARAAWRLGVVLTPVVERAALAERLAVDVGRRDAVCRRSLSRSMVDLGEAARPVLDRVAAAGAFAERVHAVATLLLLDGLQPDFGAAAEEARQVVLGAAAWVEREG